MLTGLILENFKTFGGVHPIPLGPLTVIYGANSSGKSSILQALLFLKQNVHLAENPNGPVILNGTEVDLGGFRQMSNGHRLDKSVSITPLISLYDNSKWNAGPWGSIGKANSTHSGYGFEVASDIDGSIVLGGRPVYWALSTQPAIVWRTRETDPFNRIPYDGKLDPSSPYWAYLRENSYLRVNKISDSFLLEIIDWLLSVIKYSHYKLNGTVPAKALWSIMYDTHNFYKIDDLKKAIVSKFFSYNKISPNTTTFVSDYISVLLEMRDYLSRPATDLMQLHEYINFSRLIGSNATQYPYDIWADYRIRHGGSDGREWTDYLPHANTIPDQLWMDTRRSIVGTTHVGPARQIPARQGSAHGRQSPTVGSDGQYLEDVLLSNNQQSSSALVSHVNFWLSELNINHEIRAKTYNSDRTAGVITVKDIATRATGTLRDVGFGVSQILPVITELMMPGTGPVLIEQPELHLHPDAQSRLARALNEARQRRQVIVETHSEHLLLALQNLVQTGNAKPEDVCVLKVSKNKTGSRVRRMEFGDDGNFLEPWLDGFFPDRYGVRYGTQP